jgi:hypothetical protein
MRKRIIVWLGYGTLVLAGLYSAATIVSLSFVIVSVSGPSAGTLEFAGSPIAFEVGRSNRIAAVFVTADSHFLLRCGGFEKPFGYLTPRLDLLVFVSIENCNFRSVHSYF